MNVELKALVSLALDGFKAAQLSAQKANFVLAILPALYHVASDVPAVVSNWGDLKAEIEALPGSAQEADLLAFVSGKFATIAPGSHPQAILNAVLKLVTDLANDALALESAIKGS